MGREKDLFFCGILSEGWNRFHPFDGVAKWQIQEEARRNWPNDQMIQQFAKGQAKRGVLNLTQDSLGPGCKSSGALFPFVTKESKHSP